MTSTWSNHRRFGVLIIALAIAVGVVVYAVLSASGASVDDRIRQFLACHRDSTIDQKETGDTRSLHRTWGFSAATMRLADEFSSTECNAGPVVFHLTFDDEARAARALRLSPRLGHRLPGAEEHVCQLQSGLIVSDLDANAAARLCHDLGGIGEQ
jgi:hypothetical protein